VFNDGNTEYAEQLQAAIDVLPDIETLTYRPAVMNTEVGRDIVEYLRSTRLVPTLFFIDPWGYRGLSLDLIGTAIRNWGSDCIFFFNYNRINLGINNPYVVERMNEIFGIDRATTLREKLTGASPSMRQATIISDLAEALKEVGGKYVLPFEFRSAHGERTSHYLIFVSKNFLGYHIMKDVMAGMSSEEDEVRNFEYIPVKSPQLPLLFELSKPYSISALTEKLVQECAGRTQSVWAIYEHLSVDTPYTFRNFQDAILALEAESRVTVDMPANRRTRKGAVTLGRNRMVTFPAQRGCPDGPAFRN
jgi:three-Cys-motif partner protein